MACVRILRQGRRRAAAAADRGAISAEARLADVVRGSRAVRPGAVVRILLPSAANGVTLRSPAPRAGSVWWSSAQIRARNAVSVPLRRCDGSLREGCLVDSQANRT